MLTIYVLILHTTQVISISMIVWIVLGMFIHFFFLYYYSLMELYSFEYSFSLNVVLSDDDFKILNMTDYNLFMKRNCTLKNIFFIVFIIITPNYFIAVVTVVSFFRY